MKNSTTTATSRRSNAKNKTTRMISRSNPKKKGRDYTKLTFNGEKYGKGKVVLAIVEDYVKEHPGVTYAKLKEVFPDNLHSLGIVQPIATANKKSAVHKRFFVNHVLKLKDRTVAVCSDFGKNNIGKFLNRAKEMGYVVKHAA